MNKIPKKFEQEIPKIVELTEKEAKERSNFFCDSLKDEEGLIKAIKKNIQKRTIAKDEFKKHNKGTL